MKSISKISVAVMLMFSFSSCNSQIKNTKTETVKISGNCGMCEATIESAGSIKKVAEVDWNRDNKMATITYDSTKTNQDEILRRIALAGYDSDKYLAPDDTYNKLAECCKYERSIKTPVTLIENTENISTENPHNTIDSTEGLNQLQEVFGNYFALKDALVSSDGTKASSIAVVLNQNISAVRMEQLTVEEHTIWMKVAESLKSNTGKISATKDPDKQRVFFMELSENIYELIKVSKNDTPVYYQNCPMYNDGKGANWISRESTIKNPYYGSQMLNCGKTIETIR